MAPKAARSSVCSSWDFRHSIQADSPLDAEGLAKLLKPHFSKWVFQLEKGEQTGMIHFQGRGRLIKKIRPGPGALDLQRIMQLHYFRPTCNDQHNSGGFSYMMKEATREDGPWSDKNPPPVKTADVKYIEQVGLRPWAKEMTAILEGPICPTKIYWIADLEGNNQKSTTASWWQYHKQAEMLPFHGNYKDFMQFAYGCVGERAYSINIVRAITCNNEKQREEFGQFLGGVESLKDGFLYDTRNSAKKASMDRPHVVVLANNLPLLNAASYDRWKIFKIVQGELVDITEETIRKSKEQLEEWKIRNDEKKLMSRARHDKAMAKYRQENPEISFESIKQDALQKEAQDALQKKAKTLKEYDDTTATPPVKKARKT